jgi:hypothetical protein
MALTSVAEPNLAISSSGTVLSDSITVTAVLTEESATFGKEFREESRLVDGLWGKNARRRGPEAITFCLVGSGGQLAARNVSVHGSREQPGCTYSRACEPSTVNGRARWKTGRSTASLSGSGLEGHRGQFLFQIGKVCTGGDRVSGHRDHSEARSIILKGI